MLHRHTVWCRQLALDLRRHACPRIGLNERFQRGVIDDLVGVHHTFDGLPDTWKGNAAEKKSLHRHLVGRIQDGRQRATERASVAGQMECRKIIDTR